MEKELIVTKEIAAKAILFGACKVPTVGNRMGQFSTSDLLWAERMMPIKGIISRIPLWCLSETGDGNGYGDGNGNGYGNGYGYGNGNGYGDGNGYGNGYGDGYGNGNGNGNGDGYGNGDGDGYKKLPELLNT